MNIVFLAFDRFQELDLVGSFDAFATAASFVASPVSLSIVAAERGPVTGVGGLTIQAIDNYQDAPSADILVIPGGIGTKSLINDQATLEWISSQSKAATWVFTICTGARLTASAGLLRDKRVTTHWEAIPALRESGLAKAVVDNDRFVVDGHWISSAGISAGIDASLWLIDRCFGREVAEKTLLEMEYFPEPPFTVKQPNR